MATLTKGEILAAVDLPTERVAVPEWGGEVMVRGMTGAERDAFEASLVRTRGQKTSELNLENARAKLIARTVVDEEGTRLFSDADAVALGKKSAQALQRVFEVAQRLSGLTPDDITDLTENLASGQSDGSTSA